MVRLAPLSLSAPSLAIALLASQSSGAVSGEAPLLRASSNSRCEGNGNAVAETLRSEDGAEYDICVFAEGEAACLSSSYSRGECGDENPAFSSRCEARGGRLATRFVGGGDDVSVEGASSSIAYRVCIEGGARVCTEHSYYLNNCTEPMSLESFAKASAVPDEMTSTWLIQGFSWLDENENGLSEETEGGLAEVLVNLRHCDTDELKAETTTDVNGWYQFSGVDLDKGEYYVEFLNPNPTVYEIMIGKDSSVVKLGGGSGTNGQTECMTHPGESPSQTISIHVGYRLKQTLPWADPSLSVVEWEETIHLVKLILDNVSGGLNLSQGDRSNVIRVVKEIMKDNLGELFELVQVSYAGDTDDNSLALRITVKGSVDASDFAFSYVMDVLEDHRQSIEMLLKSLDWNEFKDAVISIEKFTLPPTELASLVPTPSVTSVAGMADPSAAYCVEAGGGFGVLYNEEGDQYSLCTFEIGTACESWEYVRGECGENNPIFSAYCDDRGGQVTTIFFGSGKVDAPGASYSVCFGEDGEDCTEHSYYMGKCKNTVSNEVPSHTLSVPIPTPDGRGDVATWSNLPVSLPTPLSDMSITLLTVEDGISKEVTTGYIITGGCNNKNGTEYKEMDEGGWFECPNLSSKAYGFIPLRTQLKWGGEFTTLADMPRARSRHASVAMNGSVCVFGGRDVNDFLIYEVDCYHALSNTWSTPTILPAEYVASDLAAFVTKDNLVHLIGGFDETYVALDQVLVVNMSNFDDISYSAGPTLNAKRGDTHAAIVDNGDVYVAGGYTHENYYAEAIKSVEKYNVATQIWSEVSSLNKGRGDLQLVVSDGKIFAIGGESKREFSNTATNQFVESIEVLDSVELLDISNDDGDDSEKWTTSPSMPHRLCRFAAIEWKEEEEEKSLIFAFGGQKDYDPQCRCFPSTDKVIMFGENHESEESASEKPGNDAGSSTSPSLKPSISPTRAMAGMTGLPSPLLGENGNTDNEESTSKSPGNETSNTASPDLKPSTSSTQAMISTTVPSQSLLPVDVVGMGDTSPDVSVVLSTYPSTMSSVPSSTPTMKAEFDFDSSGWRLDNSFNYIVRFIYLVIVML